MKRFLIAIMLTAFPLILVAETVDYWVVGAGVDSCGTWIKDRKTPANWHQAGQWVNGYYSGVQLGGMALKKTDADAVLAYVDKYCAENPLKQISDAANQLILELREGG